MAQQPFLDANRIRLASVGLADTSTAIDAGALTIARDRVAAVRPLVSGVRTGTAGRRFSSILGVVEAIG